MNNRLILATSADGRKITVKDCNDFIARKDKKALANFIYDRLYGRYLKPFDFRSAEYEKNYKNGFALMTSSCLLIETFIHSKSLSIEIPKIKAENVLDTFLLLNQNLLI